eukprot:3731338-Prymnesium_polylepis.1
MLCAGRDSRQRQILGGELSGDWSSRNDKRACMPLCSRLACERSVLPGFVARAPLVPVAVLSRKYAVPFE